MSSRADRLLTTLGYFKDWTNYLLVTTVAALGWVATKPVLLKPQLLSLTVLLFCISIVFAIFTLALIPVVGELIDDNTKSIYCINGKFNVFWIPACLKLKIVCWPQHVSFLAGIIVFSYGTMIGKTCG